MVFNHVTINSGHCVTQNSKKIDKEVEKKYGKMLLDIMNPYTACVKIEDEIYGYGIWNENSYKINFFSEEDIPYLLTFGAICEEGKEELESTIKECYELCHKKQQYVANDIEPIVYNYFSGTSFFRPDIMFRTYQLSFIFGALALEHMRKNNF